MYGITRSNIRRPTLDYLPESILLVYKWPVIYGKLVHYNLGGEKQKNRTYRKWIMGITLKYFCKRDVQLERDWNRLERHGRAI